MYQLEIEIKKEIKEILESSYYIKVLTPQIIANFELYLKEDWLYFSTDKYIESELELYYQAINDYRFILARGYFVVKKDLLDFQNQLLTFQNEVIAN